MMYFCHEVLLISLQTVETLMKCRIMRISSGSSLFAKVPYPEWKGLYNVSIMHIETKSSTW